MCPWPSPRAGPSCHGPDLVRTALERPVRCSHGPVPRVVAVLPRYSRSPQRKTAMSARHSRLLSRPSVVSFDASLQASSGFPTASSSLCRQNAAPSVRYCLSSPPSPCSSPAAGSPPARSHFMYWPSCLPPPPKSSGVLYCLSSPPPPCPSPMAASPPPPALPLLPKGSGVRPLLFFKSASTLPVASSSFTTASLVAQLFMLKLEADKCTSQPNVQDQWKIDEAEFCGRQAAEGAEDQPSYHPEIEGCHETPIS